MLGGRLWDTAVSPNTPVPNELVTITEQIAGTGTAETVASATTDSNGNFAVTLNNQPVGRIFEAVFPGDTANGDDYAATTSSPVTVEPQPSTVDVFYRMTPQSPVPVGSTVTVSGTVYVPADDSNGTIPRRRSPGRMYTSRPRASIHRRARTVTSSTGTFSISFKPSSTATYHLETVANEPWPYSLYIYETIQAATTITVMNRKKPDYWFTTNTGNTYSSNASGGGPLPGPALPAAVDGIAADPSATGGYWLTGSEGNVYNFGAPWYGSEASATLNGSIAGISSAS